MNKTVSSFDFPAVRRASAIMRITFIGLAASDCKSLPDEYQRELIAARVTTFLLFGLCSPVFIKF
jgi:hypothetical protein